MSADSLKARWARLPEDVHDEIENYERELHRHLAGKVPEKVFLEFRLRHGTYGQRQPNIQMQRIKIPLGILDAEKIEVLGEVAEEYGDSICHITTRQDFQIHYINILDCPDLFRRLAEVGITTREACGNTVRNVTACPKAGVCCDETFDVNHYAEALAYFLLRHPDCQDFGRKFKIAFSGCGQHQCGLARMHDIGAIAKVREVDGKLEHGFEIHVGGGLGAVPHQAKLFDEFLPPSELLPLSQAIARVFAKRGEKDKRARARMKFLVTEMGIDAFREAVLAERAKLPEDPEWTAYLADIEKQFELPLKPPSTLDLSAESLTSDFRLFHRNNVEAQKQDGYSMVTVFLPLGDITSSQMLDLGRVTRKYTRGTIRTSVEQNFLMRWVSNEDLPQLHRDLEALQLGLPMANTMSDMTACPGTDSCKLGIASSRGLASLLFKRSLAAIDTAKANGANGTLSELDGVRQDVRVKMSGCFNSCGQHHVANIGFFGSSKRKGQRVAPVFQVLLGGTTDGNAESYGLMVAKVAAHHAPAVVDKLTKLFDGEKQETESFNACMERLGKVRIRTELEEFADITDDDAFYYDNRQPWEYAKHVEQGECAGEVVTQAEFLLDDGERFVLEASLHLEAGRNKEAAEMAVKAMRSVADGLLNTQGLLLSDKYDTVAEFKKHFVETGRFFPGLADYYIGAAEENLDELDAERPRKLVEEANLFSEEAQVVYGRMAGKIVK